MTQGWCSCVNGFLINWIGSLHQAKQYLVREAAWTYERDYKLFFLRNSYLPSTQFIAWNTHFQTISSQNHHRRRYSNRCINVPTLLTQCRNYFTLNCLAKPSMLGSMSRALCAYLYKPVNKFATRKMTCMMGKRVVFLVGDTAPQIMQVQHHFMIIIFIFHRRRTTRLHMLYRSFTLFQSITFNFIHRSNRAMRIYFKFKWFLHSDNEK